MIRFQPHNMFPNVQNVYEERYLNCEVSGWAVRVVRGQHQTWIDGAPDDAAHIVFNLRMSKGDEKYEGSVSMAGDLSGESKINWFYKTNTERRRRVETEKVQAIVEEIIAYCISPEGQVAMINQTAYAGTQELNDLKLQMEAITNWLATLDKELEGITNG